MNTPATMILGQTAAFLLRRARRSTDAKTANATTLNTANRSQPVAPLCTSKASRSIALPSMTLVRKSVYICSGVWLLPSRGFRENCMQPLISTSTGARAVTSAAEAVSRNEALIAALNR